MGIRDLPGAFTGCIGLPILLALLGALYLTACGGKAAIIPTVAAVAQAPATATPQAIAATVVSAPRTATATATLPAEPSVTSPPQAPVATTPMQQYIVQAGDDAWTIAARHNITIEALLEANGLEENSLLQPGQSLLLPTPSVASDGSAAVSYRVRAGDTFSSVASKFGISPLMLQQANPNIEEAFLQVGQILRVPWDGVHIVGPGETLQGIAYQYNVGYDELVQANPDALDFNNLHHIEVGWELVIPDVDGAVANCEPGEPRRVVIQHVIAEGEGLFCLTQKFGLQPPTIINSNPHIIRQGGLRAGMTLLIPPGDGALYVYSEDDEARAVKLDHIVGWYSAYGPLENVVDWAANPLTLPLSAGQQLYIPGADPLAGVFDSSWLVADSMMPNATVVVTGGEDGVETGANPSAASGGTFSGRMAQLWDSGFSVNDPGYCGYRAGGGWTGSLVWPVQSREIREERGYRPGHEALDISTSENSPVFAAESGVVIWAGYSSFGGGIFIMLAHGGYWHTYYGHLNEVSVGCGQQVGRGAIIGFSGKTGTSWPHVHFAVHNQSTPYNPLNYLP